MKMVYLDFLVVAGIIGSGYAFVVAPCGIGSFTCTFTPSGVSCPPNYYCPSYPEYAIQTYSQILAASSCTVGPQAVAFTKNESYQVICPCTPGFYCPANTEQPIYCAQGYYCPASSDVVTFDGQPIEANGLGAWGSEIFICPKKSFCPTGQIVPFPCPSLSNCDEEGLVKAKKTATWILIGFVIALIFILFSVTDFIRMKRRQLQDRAMPKEIVDSHTLEHSNSSSAIMNGEFGLTNLKTPINAGENGQSRDSSTSCLDGGHEAYVIEFQNMCLTLKNGTTIMAGVYGQFLPGRLCAIMGPSGAGKTTIINLVTGKVKPTCGKVLVNGEEVDGLTKYQKLVGFVPQDDVMIRELSVRDNIMFSASYRLPASMNSTQVADRVNATISELGIPHVQHSIIGDERTRGISGGQRKRVNIGIELVAAPKVLFLDEPTSGLDSTTATSLCQTLKRIAAKRDMTIVAVIHQPSVSSFLEFDDLLLLGKGGRTVYFGAVDKAPAYFERIGFPIPPHVNPADFYLDVTAGVVPRVDLKWDAGYSLSSSSSSAQASGLQRTANVPFHASDLFDLWEDHRLMLLDGERGFRTSSLSLSARKEEDAALTRLNDSPSNPHHLALFAREFFAEIYYFVEESIAGVVEDFVNYWSGWCTKDPIRITPSSFTQFRLCFQRAMKQTFVGFAPFVFEMALHLLCGAIISTAAARVSFVGPYPTVICILTPFPLQSDCANPQNSNYVQVANFMCFGILFAAIAAAAPTFGNEQVNYYRESSVGLRTVPYFLGKWLANFPRIACAALFFYVAFSVKFQNTGPSGELYGIILALYWFGFSVGYTVSQLVPIRFVALFGVPLALIFAVAISGSNPNMNAVREKPKGQQIFWDISGPRWALEAFYVSSIEYYRTVPATDDNVNTAKYEGQPYEDVITGLSNIGYDINNFRLDINGMMWDGFGWSMLALLLMLIVSRSKKR